ncbi:MAG: hypothetical protein H7145_15075 [Akkermansiaceae bacterium]|nr:hypothetical protein [Armatimonadota bacterium]
MSNFNFWIELGIVVFFVLLIGYRLIEGRNVVSDALKALGKEREAFAVLASGAGASTGNAPPPSTDTLVCEIISVAENSGVLHTDALVYPQRIARARYLAGIFVFIGLVGTVSGIALSLTSLGDVTGGDGAVTANKLQSVMTSIGAVLGGMKVSAWCTLAGIVATWNLSGANSEYLTEADKFISDIEKHWTTVLEPKRRREEQENDWLKNRLLLQDVLQNVMLTVIEKENEATRQANKELAETISTAQESQGKQLMQGMEFIAGALFEPADALRHTIIELKQGMVSTASWFSNAAQTADRVSGTLETAYRQQREGALALTEGTAALREQISTMNTAMQQVMNALDTSLTRATGNLQVGVEDHLTKIAQAQNSIEKTTNNLLRGVSDFASANNAAIESLNSDRAERDRDRETWEIEIDAMLREQERARQAWANERGETMKAFGEERAGAYSFVRDTLAEVQKSLAAQNREFHAALTARQAESLREVQTMRAVADAALTNAQNAVAAMQKDSKTAVKAMTDAAHTALTNATSETSRAQDTAARFNIAADRTLDILEKAHDNQQARTEKLIAAVVASENRLAELLKRFETTLSSSAQQAEKGDLREALQTFTTELNRSLNTHTVTVTALRETASRLDTADAMRNADLKVMISALAEVSERLYTLPDILRQNDFTSIRETSIPLSSEVAA